MKLRIVVICIFLLSSILAAQSFRGGIVGVVTDVSGASVAGAQVTATNTGTGLTRQATTDGAGNYTFTELPLGNYSVTVVKQGFRTEVATNIQVAVEGPQRANVTLTPGRVEEKVEVKADVPLVETSSNTLGGTIQATQIEDLPVNGRDYMKMLTLVPGANADTGGAADSPGSFGVFSVNGNRGRSNNFLLDGTDMNDGFRNDNAINEGGVFGIPATLLPLDAVQEMAILNNTEAEYGRNSGSIVNMVTKSGTNSLHGTAFEYLRNNALDARNYFNAVPVRQNAFRNNQFGGSLGGAIVKDKTFFFLAYEGQRETVGFPSAATVPSQADIAAATAANGGVVNPIIQNILNTNPWGPLPATNELEEVNAPSTNRLDSMIAKIDQHLRKDDLLTGRYYFGDSAQSAPLAIGGGNVLPGFNTVVPTRVQVVSISYTHVFSPAFLGEFRFGWNRFAETFTAQDASINPASLGLNTANSNFTNADYGLPVINVGGFASFGSSKSDPRGRVDSNWHFLNNYSLNRGSHSWKAGFEFRRTSVNQYFDLNHRGILSFNNLDDFIAGNVSGGGSQTLGNSHRDTYQDSVGLYLQDNFRLSHRLSLNYGLRWDYYGVIGEKNNLFSILPNLYSGSIEQVGVSGGPSSLYPKDYHNFSPRIGIAYDVFGTGKTILRLGYGFAYDAFSQDFFAGQVPYTSSNAGPLFNDVGSRPISYGSVTNGLTPVACGSGTIPIPGSSLCAAPVYGNFGFTDVFTVDQNLRTPYVQNYNLNIEQQLTGRTALSVAYVGSSGRKLFRFIDENQGLPSQTALISGRLNPAYYYVLDFQSSAISDYNSLQTSLKMRDVHGFTSTINYTYSHSIDEASDGQDYAPFQGQPQNSQNVRGDRANSGFDQRQHLTWIWDYRIPEAHAMKWLTNGWAMSGAITFSAGMPFTPMDYSNYNNTGEFYERPDLVGNPWAGTSSPGNFLNLSAFAASCAGFLNTTTGNWVCTGNQHFGDSPRNGFSGPHYRNFDLSFFKDTKITERVTVKLGADFFNVFNHPNFANPLFPSFNVLWGNNGISATGTGVGFLPVTVTPDVGATNPFLGGGGPRDIQVSLRLSF